ncbi:copper resistance protein CopK [Cupriavidus sp. SK-3]|uniref:periplasmic Cu(I)/Cu(II)-binding protein CopK n=1 Tax=Cupriavidus sp. SK-3 TaxID=1470558 RepID=UPI00044F0155|nr:periplasmic Cu(I)/Cu(II)-binding protein CopK [Cupriavidus sp. SK-3]KDP87246.1 copper resistance protein CopK [Cupriavidus sp. SK-3]
MSVVKGFLLAAGASTLAFSVFAADPSRLEQKFELKDGSTLYIFKDGKMGMEDKLGRPASMKEGLIMETKDGQKIMMQGNEVWRVDRLLPNRYQGQ